MWRIDYSQLAPHAGDDEEHILVVSRFTLELVHALAELSFYRSTFTNVNADDYDTLDALLDRARYELMQANLSTLATRLSDINSTLSSLRNTLLSLNFCCDNTPPSPIPPPTPDLPPPPGGGISPDWDDETGWGEIPITEYQSALCKAVNAYVVYVLGIMRLVENNTLPLLGVAIVASLVAILLPEGVSTALGTISFSALAVLLVQIVVAGQTLAGLADNLQQQVEAAWPTVRETLCLAQTGYDALDSLANSVAEIVSVNLEQRGVPAPLVGALRSALTGSWVRQLLHYFVANTLAETDILLDCACASNVLTRVNFGDVVVSGSQVTWELEDNGTTLSVAALGQWPEVVITFPAAYSALLSKVLNLTGGEREVTHGAIPSTPNCTSGYWVSAATSPPSVTSGLYTEDDSLLPEWPNRYIAASYCSSRHYRVRYGGTGTFKVRLWKA